LGDTILVISKFSSSGRLGYCKVVVAAYLDPGDPHIRLLWGRFVAAV